MVGKFCLGVGNFCIGGSAIFAHSTQGVIISNAYAFMLLRSIAMKREKWIVLKYQ